MRPRVVALLLLAGLLAVPLAAQEVTLPLGEYEALRARSRVTPTPAPTPPAPWVLEDVRLEIDVAARSARLVEHLTLSLFAPGWQVVPIPAPGTLVRADLGRLEGRVAGDGSWRLNVRGQGRHTVRLEWAVSIARDERALRPSSVVELVAPDAAVASGVVRADATVEEVVFAKGAIGRGERTTAGWRFVATPGRVLRVELLGKAAAPARARLPLAFDATSAVNATISKTRTKARAWLALQVRQGRMETVDVEIPDGLSVVTVGGGPLAGWDVHGSLLTITPIEPVDASLELEIELTGAPREETAPPLVRPRGAGRTLLAGAVAAEGGGLVELLDPGSGRQPDERERAALPRAFLAAARYPLLVADVGRTPRFRLSWPTETETLAAQIDRLMLDVVVGESGQAAYQLWAVVRTSGATSLALTPPPGFAPFSSARDGGALAPGERDTRLVLPLAGSSEAQVVHLAGLLPLVLGEGRAEVPLPAFSAPIGRVEFRLVVPPGRRYRLEGVEAGGRITPPAATAAPASFAENTIALQVKQSAVEATRSELFVSPPGAIELTGGWSALSAAPGPLRLTIENAHEKREWF